MKLYIWWEQNLTCSKLGENAEFIHWDGFTLFHCKPNSMYKLSILPKFTTYKIFVSSYDFNNYKLIYVKCGDSHWELWRFLEGKSLLYNGKTMQKTLAVIKAQQRT